jgi:hypothetical protein
MDIKNKFNINDTRIIKIVSTIDDNIKYKSIMDYLYKIKNNDTMNKLIYLKEIKKFIDYNVIMELLNNINSDIKTKIIDYSFTKFFTDITDNIKNPNEFNINRVMAKSFYTNLSMIPKKETKFLFLVNNINDILICNVLEYDGINNESSMLFHFKNGTLLNDKELNEYSNYVDHTLDMFNMYKTLNEVDLNTINSDSNTFEPNFKFY